MRLSEQTNLKMASRGLWALAVAFCLLFLLVVPAQATLIQMSISWGYFNGIANNQELMQTYGLQEGSIIQVIMYNSSTSAAPGSDATDNFDIFGNYSGDPPLPGEPNYAPFNQYPSDNTIYKPESTPAGHTIVGTGVIGTAEYGDGEQQHGWWYETIISLDVAGGGSAGYDSVYIRVFGMTAFPDGSVGASYWGISGVQDLTPGELYDWGDYWFTETVAGNVNYFEVIPEPGTMSLLAAGTMGLLAARRRRKKIQTVSH